MKTTEIYYAHGRSIEVEIPRKKRNQVSFKDAFVRGDYINWKVKVVKGLDKFVSHVIKKSNDYNSNGGKWYAHCNGFCLDAIVDYDSKETAVVKINSFYGYRKAFL